MGRYNLSPSQVHKTATSLLAHRRLASPPPWYSIISSIPPSERLTRPPLQRSQLPSGRKKASRLFKPLRLQFGEDRLRWEFFNDHPWELARPRVVLEDDGRDAEKWDWSVPLDHALLRPRSGEVDGEGREVDGEWDAVRQRQAGRPINGEAVIRRQTHLLTTGLPPAQAYDTARKEFYAHRLYTATEQRVAREEALSTGAFFGPGALEVGMKMEDREYEGWRVWAREQSEALRQLQGSAYTGQEAEETGPQGQIEEVQQVGGSVPGSKRGQEAKGGVAVHP